MLNTFRKGVFALYVFYDVDIIFIAMRTSLHIAFFTDPQEKENKCSGYIMEDAFSKTDLLIKSCRNLSL